jgi:CRISPR-associated DxTHG motif protein
MKQVVVTILGTIGANSPKSSYLKGEVEEIKEGKYINALPVLIESYPDADIIPIFTPQARKKQEEVLKAEKKEKWLKIFDKGEEIKNEKDFDALFSTFHKIFDKYREREFVVDVTHGFRHLPLLLLIELLIKNFQETGKISRILFAKELEKVNWGEQKGGKFEFIDLKSYLELANVAFILGNFRENYTLSSHIPLGVEFEGLTRALDNFSHDILVFNISRLFDESVPQLKRELEKIRTKPSIQRQVEEFLEDLETNFTRYPDEPQFYRYYRLAKLLYQKGYLLNSLTLLNESVRFFLSHLLKQREPELMEKAIEGLREVSQKRGIPYSDYILGDFAMKIFKANPTKRDKMRENYNSLRSELKQRLGLGDFYRLVRAIPFQPFKKWQNCPYNPPRLQASLFECITYARNTFAHANRQNRFADIKRDIRELFKRYYAQIEPYLGEVK